MDQSDGPRGLGARIAVARGAAETVWNEAMVSAVLEKVDDETRAVFRPDAILAEWIPEKYFVDFINALWAVARGEKADAKFLRWVDIVTDRGFAEARELFTSLGGPLFVLRRAQELWSYEHSTGTLVHAPLGMQSARLTLRDHPFLETEATRDAISEAFRYVVQLTGASGVTESHALTSDGYLHVVLAWTDPAAGDPNV